MRLDRPRAIDDARTSLFSVCGLTCATAWILVIRLWRVLLLKHVFNVLCMVLMVLVEDAHLLMRVWATEKLLRNICIDNRQVVWILERSGVLAAIINRSFWRVYHCLRILNTL